MSIVATYSGVTVEWNPDGPRRGRVEVRSRGVTLRLSEPQAIALGNALLAVRLMKTKVVAA